MARALTLEKYSELMLALADGHKIKGVADFLEKPTGGSVAVIIHPVRKSPERAAAMALAEKRLGIRATYYFGWDPKAVNWAGAGEERYGNFPELAVTEAKLYGHEVGYIPGADNAARLKILRKLAPVRTSLTELDEPGILGGPFSAEFSDFELITNAGKAWAGAGGRLKGAGEAIKALGSGEYQKVLLSICPEVWK